MLDSVLMRSVVRWPDMLVCTYLAFCALRIFDSARNRKWKWERRRERKRLEIGGRDREEMERSVKRVFILQRNQSAPTYGRDYLNEFGPNMNVCLSD